MKKIREKSNCCNAKLAIIDNNIVCSKCNTINPEVKSNDIEITLYINNKIIVQRFYNFKIIPKKQLINDNIDELITNSAILFNNHLDNLTTEYLNKYKHYKPNNLKEDIFTIKYNILNVIRTKDISSGNTPPKIKYNVDIRQLLPIMKNNIHKTLNTINKKFLNYEQSTKIL